jgi:2-(1,2-epoxy-1,2-dihydrophenyl)acetyl-CoA isomerase
MDDAASLTAHVKAEIEDGVGIITLNDPATLNSASLALMETLSKAFSALVIDPQVRAILLTGEGRGFCSGANLAGDRVIEPGARPNQAVARVYNPFMSMMRASPKPLVAAVNGAAAGIGASFALACDLIVAAESAYFLQAFRRVGLVPDGGATYMLPRLVGKARAMELVLLGDKLPARTALDWGLINRCVPDAELMPTALGLARQLAAGPYALGLTRSLIWASLDAAWATQTEAEAYVQAEAAVSEDSREGIAAFVEKRPARFKGR